jgi:uncharacterized protein
MGRLVVLILLVVAVAWLVRRALRQARNSDSEKQPPAQADLVSCAQCGMYLPRAEARLAGERAYCSDEHARLGPRQG